MKQAQMWTIFSQVQQGARALGVLVVFEYSRRSDPPVERGDPPFKDVRRQNPDAELANYGLPVSHQQAGTKHHWLQRGHKP